MPRPSKLAIAVFDDLHDTRDKSIPFNNYIFDINFDSKFKHKIDKQVEKFIHIEKQRSSKNITYNDKFNKILHTKIVLKELQIAIKLLRNNKSPEVTKFSMK